MVFGTDWPGVPGVQRNARALEKVLIDAGASAGRRSHWRSAATLRRSSAWSA